MVKQFTEEKQKEAHTKGYTTTAWGRRRYIAHLLDEKYEYHYNENRPVDFNPLFTAKSVVQQEVSQEIKDEYNDKIEKANYYTKKKIIEKAKLDGIDIIDNSNYIQDSNRQILNSIIQGSASDMTKRAMIAIGTNQELKDLGFKMLFPVHDEIIAECPFKNRKRCGELMSQLMIAAGAEKINVPMKCDVEKFFYWYGPDIDDADDELSMKQYNDYVERGIYLDRNDYQ